MQKLCCFVLVYCKLEVRVSKHLKLIFDVTITMILILVLGVTMNALSNISPLNFH